jgi:hypothetical protein
MIVTNRARWKDHVPNTEMPEPAEMILAFSRFTLSGKLKG